MTWRDGLEGVEWAKTPNGGPRSLEDEIERHALWSVYIPALARACDVTIRAHPGTYSDCIDIDDIRTLIQATPDQKRQAIREVCGAADDCVPS